MAPSLKFWKNKDERVKQSAGTLTPTIGYAVYPLRDQHVICSAPETKIRVAILSTALVDALGGPVEFKSRFTFPFVESFKLNHNFRDKANKPLQPGVWTDDTSMTLCLARSIAQGAFDEGIQLNAYLKWREQGELSAIGFCFDIGNTTSRALSIHARASSAADSLQAIEADLSRESNAGNGSLMRLIPVPLAFWRDPQAASHYARRSSKTTHPNALCQEVCAFWTDAVVQIMQKACTGQAGYSKLDFLQYIAAYPFENAELKAALSLPVPAPTSSSEIPSDSAGDNEERYWQHPILRLIAKTRDNATAQSTGYLKLPPSDILPSSGYVLDSLIAALYCFFATDNFETGAIMAVNLGSDADTTGAIYAGLAACWYGEALPKEFENDLFEEIAVGSGLFWSLLVRGWRKALVNRDLVEEVAEELVNFEREWKPENL